MQLLSVLSSCRIATTSIRKLCGRTVMSHFFFGFLQIASWSVSVQAQSSFRSKSTHVFKESIPLLSSRSDILKQSRMINDYNHEVIFVIKQKNMEELTRFLHDVSDPLSDNYGQHMTRTGVIELTANPEGRNYVLECLHATGATVVSETLGSEYVTASAPISVWEKMFDCEFFMFHQTLEDMTIKEVVRAESYSIPAVLNNHVESVFNTVDMPHENVIKARFGPAVSVGGNERFTLEASSFTNPEKIRSAYNMGTSVGTASSTQGIYASLSQYYSPSDLSRFQSAADLDQQSVSSVIGDHESDSACILKPASCSEANLDVQYIMAASPVSPTTYWYTDVQLYSDWLMLVANTAKPSLVYSISYGIEEMYVTLSERDAFNTQAIKLSAMGVTIVAASGDDGALSLKVRTGGTCKYGPIFPASSPYVTAVGATMGVETGTTEIACASDTSGVITTGGGFSIIHSQPSFQTKAVAQYFVNAAAAGQTPASGYNAAGRAFPDVSLAGSTYAVYIGGLLQAVSGTSASTPVMAGFLSNINAARIASGKGSVGWVNPALYTNSSLFVNDITSGNNKCASTNPSILPICCTQGFTATTGWDPVTGLGSINYGKMVASFSALGSVTSAPSKAPTSNSAPSIIPQLKTSSSCPSYGATIVTLAVSIVGCIAILML